MGKLNLTICGFGNGAHACAVLLGSKGHKVNIYSPLENEVDVFKQNSTDNKLTAILPNGQKKTSILNKITSKASEVIPDASIIFIIVPSFAHNNILRNIEPYISDKSIIVTIPVRSGFEYQAKHIINKGSIVGLQTLPWACRIVEFGKTVEIKGTKLRIQAATIPSQISDVLIYQLEQLLEVKLVMVRNMLAMTLSNVGQIIHPGIMYGIFRDNPSVKFIKKDIPLFYQSVDDDIAKVLSNISNEVQIIAKAIDDKIKKNINLEEILTIEQWLEDSYGSLIKDKSSLSKMFISNEAYQGLTVPVKKYDDNYYVPDFETRYITEDLPYGLLVTKSIAAIFDVRTPQIDKVIKTLGDWTNHDFMNELMVIKNMALYSRIPEVFGINTLDDFKRIYG